MEKWDIQPFSSSCSRCGAEIEPQMPFFSLLLRSEGEEGQLSREDLCEGCFKSEAPLEKGRPQLLAYWKSFRPAEEKKAGSNSRRPFARVDLDLVEKILKDLLKKEGGSEFEEELKYVLALLLLRRRRVELVGKGKGLLRFCEKKTGQSFEIADPEISEERISQLTSRLGELLWEKEFSLLTEES